MESLKRGWGIALCAVRIHQTRKADSYSKQSNEVSKETSSDIEIVDPDIKRHKRDIFGLLVRCRIAIM